MPTATELADERQTSQQADGNRTHTRSFVVELDATQDGVAALSAIGLPPLYSLHPNDAGALLIRRNPRQHPDSHTHWFVTCEYNTNLSKAVGTTPGGSGGGQPPESHENPLQEPPDIAFSGVRYQEAIDTDWDGQRIKNAAGQLFDPPETQDWAYLALDVQRNMATFNPNMIATHLYSVNFDPYLGFQQDEVLLDDCKAKPKWSKGIFYWDVSARFLFNPVETITVEGGGQTQIGGWYARKLNVGFEKLVGGIVSRIVLPDGTFPSRPQLLDANGGHPYAGPPLYKRFRKWRRKSLQALGII